VAVSATGFLGYYNIKLRRVNDELTNNLDVLKNKIAGFEEDKNDVDILQNKLETTEQGRDADNKKIVQLQSQLKKSDEEKTDDANKIRQLNETVIDLNKELVKMKAAMAEVAKLKDELKNTIAARDDFETKNRDLTGKLLNEIKEKNDALKAQQKAEKKVKELEQKLASLGQSDVKKGSEDTEVEDTQTEDEGQTNNISNAKKISEESKPTPRENLGFGP
jgi:chromosome segregation ATPase